MAQAPQDPHPDELYSDLNVLVEMTKDPKQDYEVVVRHLESLKTKLDKFIRR